MLALSLMVAVMTLATSPGLPGGPLAIPPQGLRWAFDDRLNEESPRHLDGSARGPVAFADSPIGGKAIVLDGKGSGMIGPSSARMDLSGGEITVAAWIEATEAKQAGIVCLGGYSWRHGWLLDMHRNGSLRLELSAPGNKHFDTILSGGGVILPGRWTHVAAVIRVGPRPGPSRLYVNGVQVASKTFEPVDIINPQAVLTVGGIENAAGAGFPGRMDEVRLFGRVLSDAEIAALVEPGKRFAVTPRPGPALTCR